MINLGGGVQSFVVFALAVVAMAATAGAVALVWLAVNFRRLAAERGRLGAVAPTVGAGPRAPVDESWPDLHPDDSKAVAIARRKALITRFVDISPSPCYVKDASDGFRYVVCNDAFAKLTGLDKDRIVGSTDEELFGPKFAMESRAKDEEALESDAPLFYEGAMPTTRGGVGYKMNRRKQRIVTWDGVKLIFCLMRDEMYDSRRADSEAFKAKLLAYAIDHLNHEENIEYIARLLVEYFGCDRVAIRFSDGPRHICWADGRREDDATDGRKAAWEAFGTGDIVNVEDASRLNPESWPEGAGTMAFLGARVMKGGEMVVQVAAMFDKEPHHFFEVSESVVMFAAETLALSLERARLQRPYQIANANFETMSRALHELQASETLDDLTPFVKIVCERFNADYCSLVKVLDDGHSAVVCQYDPDRVSVLPDLRRGIADAAVGELADRFGEHDAIELGDEESRRLWLDHGFDEAQIASAAIRHTQLAAVRVNGKFWGAIQIGHHSRRRLSDDEWGHLHRLAEVLSIAIRRRDAHDELKAALDRARAADKAKFFFSTVSHDIRTPLNAVIGLSQMLKLGFATEQERDNAIDSIILSGKTLLQLVNDVLDLSKLEAGKVVVSPEPTDCAKLISEIVGSFKVANPGAAVDIRSRMSPMPLLEIDPQRIRQIIFNLAGNAVKFTVKGFVEVRASFEPDSPGAGSGTLTVAVEDTGCGISNEERKFIDTPYVQFGKGVKKGGTGLGLAICRQLASAMHGRIEFESEVGRGTVFYLKIPGVKTCAGTVRPGRKDAQLMSLSAVDAAHSRYTKVLIADDSKVNLMVLSSMLKRLGVREVVKAENGKEALERLREGGFDLVLTDMWMPELDGEGLVRAMRADRRFDGLPVYAITADVEIRNHAALDGFNGILLKPVTFDVLKPVLNA